MFGTNFNPRFIYSIEGGLKLFLNYTSEILVEACLKQSTYTLQLLLGAPLKAEHLHTLGALPK